MTVFNRQQLALYDRELLTLIAAKEAIKQSGIIFSGELAAKSGVVLGTAGGGVSTWYIIIGCYEEGKIVFILVVPKLRNNAAASYVSMEYT